VGEVSANLSNPSSLNRQIGVDAFGVPVEVARCRRQTVPAPAAGEVLVRTAFAPINPADVNVLEGRYGSLPELPAVVGNEGAGSVALVGEGVTDLGPGDRVIYLGRRDCWQDYVMAARDELLRVPAELDLRLASMLKVNPLTALLLLREGGELEPGAWVVQNAANSGVGRAVIAVAKAKGLRTANFVRREELVDELTAVGADFVAVDDDAGREAARAAIGDAPVRLALNAVGGESALRGMSLLSNGGVSVTYGAMGKRPLKVPNSFLIFKGMQLRGLWISKWLETSTRAEIEAAYGELAEMMVSGELPQPVDAEFPPEEIAAALGRAMEGSRAGKVLLDFTGGEGEGS
jgi:trans-2-enoyl-CoA reductase